MDSKRYKLDLLRSGAAWLRAAAADERGGFAVWFAAMVPAVSALAIGAVELQTLSADRTVMQDAADAAALAGAKELATGTPGVTDRAEAMAEATLAVMSQRYKTMDVRATLGGDSKSLVVTISANRLSFFGNLVPPGGFKTLVTAQAGTMNQQQLCVMTTSPLEGDILIQGLSGLNAAGCLVHSSKNLTVDSGASMTALAAQAVGRASGSITPSGMSGAENVPDPFSGRSFLSPTCTAAQFIVQRDSKGDPVLAPDGSFTPIAISTKITTKIPPGRYCGMFQIEDGGEVELAGGDYYFVGVKGDPLRQGKLSMKGGRLTSDPIGPGVTLIFDDSSKLHVQSADAKLNLKAQNSGTNAGLLLVAPRDNTKQFTLQSPAVEVLEGVIYMPSAELVVAGDKVGNLSKWTITITKALTVHKGASLMIKSDYAGSTVPVPGAIKAASSEDIRLFREGESSSSAPVSGGTTTQPTTTTTTPTTTEPGKGGGGKNKG
jgi:Flp pilus assembly protein TadG